MSNKSQKPFFSIGSIAKNGEMHLQKTFEATDALTAALADRFECRVLLVDSASTDSTGALMKSFAETRSNVRVFELSGDVNASAARNLYLDHVEPGYLLVIDGDIAVEIDFVEQAIKEIEDGNADILYGKLPEIWYDERGSAYGGQDDRYNVHRREYIEWFKGAFIMGPKATAAKLRYDESLERLEDIEFSLRAAEQFRVLTLPVPMATHHTDGYHSRTRLKDFVAGGYQIPAGQFIRTNLFKPHRLLRVRRAYIGYLVGLAMQAVVVLGLLLLSPLLLALGIAVLCFDFFRFYRQGRVHEFLPLRFIGAWQILIGFFKPKRAVGPYQSREISTD